MSDEQWADAHTKALGVRLAGDLIDQVDERGEPIKGDTLLLLINAHWEQLPFKLPVAGSGDIWQMLVDTADADRKLDSRVWAPSQDFPLYGRSLVLLRTVRENESQQEVSSTQLSGLRRELRASPPPSIDGPSQPHH